jgi:adenylate cyclase
LSSRATGARRKTISLLLVALVAAGAGVLAYATHLLRRSELQTIDARFSIRGRQHPPPNTELVEIDGVTFEQLRREGLRSEWPFPRRYDAKVIDELRSAGARAIALDIEFTHPTDPGDDEALAEAIARAHGKVVLATTEVGPKASTPVLGGEAVLREIGARAAEAGLTFDADGTVRRVAASIGGLSTFAVATAEVFSGRPVRRSLFQHGPVPMDFAGPTGTWPAVSFSKVLKGEVPTAAFAGKLVIVGASAPILNDVHSTATSGSRPMPGPEIQANAVSTLMRGGPLKFAGGWLNVLLTVLLGLLVPLGSLRVRRWRTMFDALALAVLFAVANQLAFDGGLIVTFVYPLLALVLGTLGALAVLYVGEAIERERVRSMFARFVPSDVVEEVLASAGGNLRLGAVERDCTVLFSDLRGFTSFSETQPAARVIEVVNHYLGEMTEAILDAGGTLIAYMGDGIMALFGAPLQQDDHADRAVAAAREMIGPRLERFNAWLAEQGYEHAFEMGVGLNSGPVMAGNVGSEQRVEYTAIGDTTNTASRLEGMTKNSDAMLFVAESTRERMRSGADELVPVGEFEVRGRTGTLAVYTVPSGAREREPAERGGVAG